MPYRLLRNARAGTPGTVVLPAGGYRRAKAEIMHWPGYVPTPLRDLPALARRAGVDVVRLKDEGGRFGLGSYKALGGAYALGEAILTELARSGVSGTRKDLLGGRAGSTGITAVCAAEGGHGRSVAWGARRFGAGCVVFVPEAADAAGLTRLGAEVRRVAGLAAGALREAVAAAVREGWLLVAETSWPGYTEVPRLVMQGYRLMPDEALDAWEGAPPTHVFMQTGAGAGAAAVSVQLRARLAAVPALVVVEPERAAGLLASAAAGRLSGAGEPSLLAWQELERSAAAFVAVAEEDAVEAMRLLAGLGVAAGAEGAVGLAGLLAVAGEGAAREALGLDGQSRILLFSTEAPEGER